jgi:hypothetical protein
MLVVKTEIFKLHVGLMRVSVFGITAFGASQHKTLMRLTSNAILWYIALGAICELHVCFVFVSRFSFPIMCARRFIHIQI